MPNPANLDDEEVDPRVLEEDAPAVAPTRAADPTLVASDLAALQLATAEAYKPSEKPTGPTWHTPRGRGAARRQRKNPPKQTPKQTQI
jgi:hypothetical protein